MNTHFFNNGKIKVLQAKQEPKTWKDSISAQLYVFSMNTYTPPVVGIISWWPLFSTKRHTETFEYHIHWNINIRKNKFCYKNMNGSAGSNKPSEEQH